MVYVIGYRVLAGLGMKGARVESVGCTDRAWGSTGTLAQTLIQTLYTTKYNSLSLVTIVTSQILREKRTVRTRTVPRVVSNFLSAAPLCAANCYGTVQYKGVAAAVRGFLLRFRSCDTRQQELESYYNAQ